jgi:L-rhamnose mutarotase
MAVFLLPGKKKQGMFYDDIKRYFTNIKPIPTQVILTSTACKDKGVSHYSIFCLQSQHRLFILLLFFSNDHSSEV